jgi:hypothetical protein
MVDYDGADKLYTIINALNWAGAGLTEPTYLMWEDRQNTEYINYIIYKELGAHPTRHSDSTLLYTYTVQLEFFSNTKANMWPSLRFLVKGLFAYTGGAIAIDTSNLPISFKYSQTRKIPTLTITLTEVEADT